MSFSNDVEVKTVELPDALEFTVTREDGLYAVVFAPAIAFVGFWYFWKVTPAGWPHIVMLFIAISSAASYVASKLHGRETRLRVTSDEIIAEGNLGRIFSTNFRLAASDIVAIRFNPGGDGDTQGLYVWHGWTNACVVPGISRAQADSIVEAIARRF